MNWTADQLPDQTGRTVMITGANSGIGFEAAKSLAARGAEVVLACRNEEAGRQAAAQLSGHPRVERLDLASLQSVREFAQRWQGPLDLLVNNAGVMTPPRYQTTAEGHELQFGTNHLGHFALTGLLMPALLATQAPRVVTIASIAHHGGDESVLAGNPQSSYKPQKAYSNSKLANLLFHRELHRRYAGRLTATAAHPGVSATGLFVDAQGLGSLAVVRAIAPVVMPLVVQGAKAGATPTLYAGSVAEPGSYTGPQRLRESRGPIGPARMSRYAVRDDLAQQLWDLSVRATEVEF